MKLKEMMTWAVAGTVLGSVILVIDLLVSGGLDWAKIPDARLALLGFSVVVAAVGCIVTFALVFLLSRWSPRVSPLPIRLALFCGGMASVALVSAWLNGAFGAYGYAHVQGDRVTLLLALLVPLVAALSFVYLALSALILRRGSREHSR